MGFIPDGKHIQPNIDIRIHLATSKSIRALSSVNLSLSLFLFRPLQLSDELKQHLNQTMSENYDQPGAEAITLAVDRLQQDVSDPN